MMRLIDANKLNSVEKEIVFEKVRTPFAKDLTATRRVFEFDEIQNAPTVDAMPVVHAHWIDHGSKIKFGFGKGMCSNCKMIEEMYKGKSFCPYCGAMMNEMEVDHNEQNT